MIYKTIEDIEVAKFLLSPPGDTLQDTINHKGISQAELSKRMKRPLKTINEIIKGKSAILSDTALQLEKVLGISAEFWVEREKQYRLELARISEAEKLLEAKDWLSNFPLTGMKKLGWINYDKNNIIEQFSAILTFFSVSGIEAYQHFYGKHYATNVAFRMSANNDKNINAVNAWIRNGHLQANELLTPKYDKQKFLDVLLTIKELATENLHNFFKKVQELCLSAGVKVVHTPNLSQVKLHGSTFWLNDNPVIQLSNYYKRNDIFWFSFFHEAGHIIKHGKKEIFVEGLEHSEEGKEKEIEADQFAVYYTFSEQLEKQFIAYFQRTGDVRRQIIKFAAENNVLPAIIMGRLAKQNILHDSIGWQLNIYEKIELN